ncbi:hypothetical protein J1614_006415 [Plenodomus biglobosus]|nr:hypothetical protein J1614_006415 [Plenodomus biglobosus]
MLVTSAAHRIEKGSTNSENSTASTTDTLKYHQIVTGGCTALPQITMNPTYQKQPHVTSYFVLKAGDECQ